MRSAVESSCDVGRDDIQNSQNTTTRTGHHQRRYETKPWRLDQWSQSRWPQTPSWWFHPVSGGTKCKVNCHHGQCIQNSTYFCGAAVATGADLRPLGVQSNGNGPTNNLGCLSRICCCCTMELNEMYYQHVFNLISTVNWRISDDKPRVIHERSSCERCRRQHWSIPQASPQTVSWDLYNNDYWWRWTSSSILKVVFRIGLWV